MPRSPNYTSLSLIEMREVVARTLRDPNGGVFSVDALNDFIAEGLMSLSGYRPIEAVETIAYAPDNYGDVQYVEPTILSHIWQVMVSNEEDITAANQSVILPYVSTGESALQNGWDYYGGRVYFGRWAVGWLDSWFGHAGAALSVVLYGYRDRALPIDDDEVLDLEDAVDQLCLTRECRALGFQLLNNDRALYQQWLAATNNTDVSPTQLQGMLSNAVGDVERQRKRSAILRRNPIIGPQYP